LVWLLTRPSMRTLTEFSSNPSEPDATKLSIVPLLRPAALGSGISFSSARACGERRACGITLPANCWRWAGSPVAGSKMFTPYALRSPARAAAVGTVSSRDPPTVLRVP
jgi:hypothetical protein